MDKDFRCRWLARFGLSEPGLREQVKAHALELPFSDPKTVESLLEGLFEEVPLRLRRKSDRLSMLLAEAFGWCCYSFWQCGSAMSSFPENYAEYLYRQFLSRKRDPSARLLASFIVEGEGPDGRCGFNRLRLARPEIVRDSERLMHEGGYEAYSNAEVKYNEFLDYLRHSEKFQSDWAALKKSFPARTRTTEIIHRSLLPERNWERGSGARFDTPRARFQSAFDLFCWKYYLWGMRGDEPLLMKPSIVFTPLGTQILIPGYLSLDAKRDLDFGKISRLHRARGLARQGEGFSTGRREFLKQARQARTADQLARKLGLKGDARYEFIRKELALPEETDYRRVRSLLHINGGKR